MTDPEQSRIDTLAAQLGEDWEAVQIMLSRTADGGGTERYFIGSGNWYARQGMDHTFIQREEAEEIGNAVKAAGEGE